MLEIQVDRAKTRLVDADDLVRELKEDNTRLKRATTESEAAIGQPRETIAERDAELADREREIQDLEGTMTEFLDLQSDNSLSGRFARFVGSGPVEADDGEVC